MSSKEQLEEDYGQEVSTIPAAFPDKTISLKGSYVTLTQWKPDYVPSLWQHVKHDPKLVIYMPARDISTEEDLREDLKGLEDSEEIICYAIMADPAHLNPRPEGSAVGGEHTQVLGLAFYGHFSKEDRATETGVMFAPVLQRTAASTEVHYLLLKHVLDEDSPILGEGGVPYRRVAWKCNRLNTKSRNSALRVGFVFEGTNRQIAIVKGRTRDDDVFSMLDSEWPASKAAMERWFDRANWDGEGRQRRKLQEIRAGLGHGGGDM